MGTLRLKKGVLKVLSNRVNIEDNMARNQEARKQYYRDYYRKNLVKRKIYERLRNRSIPRMFRGYRDNAKRRGFTFDLSKTEFESIVINPCNYCGESGNPYQGIDRVDSELGYFIANCVSCCSQCNAMKKNFTLDSFIDKCVKISERFFRDKSQSPPCEG